MQYTAADRDNIENGTPNIIMLHITRLDQGGLRQASDHAITFGGCSSRGSCGAIHRSAVTERPATEVGEH